MPTLADIYSAIDSAKRKGSDLIRNPGASLQQIAGYGMDRANAARDQLYEATEAEGIGYGPKTKALAQQMAGAYNPIGIISPQVAKTIKMPVNLPKQQEFLDAVSAEPSAALTSEGLRLKVKRQQNPLQSGEESVRTGVFYLPESQNIGVYKGKTGYGGTEPIQGETLYKNPIFVQGATGGKAPEVAYDQLLGKGSYQAMRDDALKAASSSKSTAFKIEKAKEFLEKYGGDPSMASYIVQSSPYGNQLTYALQEHAVAHSVRNAGHDAVLGYSKKRTGEPFFSEIYDVRENMYPTKQGDFQLHPYFENLTK